MARSLVQHFTDWARQQGDAQYDYGDITNCALCQFLNANGYAKTPRVGGDTWRDASVKPMQRHDIDERLAEALVSEPRTFAALADRLSA
jgi:hypothetical protein